jgi:hypothetical protein
MNRKVKVLGTLAVATAIGTQVASSQDAQRQIQLRSAPVTVTNTPLSVTVTNPAAPVDQPGRIAYQSFQQSPSPCAPTGCSFLFPAVPAQHRLVIQSVSGVVNFSNVPTAIEVSLFDGKNSQGGVATFFAPFVLSTAAFLQPLLLYIEGQGLPVVNVQLLGAGTFPQGTMTLSGYLLDCAASPCAPISQ